MRQRRWMELTKDYDYDILYHSGNVSKVTDALSRESLAAQLVLRDWILFEKVRNSVFKSKVGHLLNLMTTLRIEPKVHIRIKMSADRFRNSGDSIRECRRERG